MRSRERVARILSAAAELIERGGIAAVNTNAVAKTAGLPVGTLYQFFPNREAVLEALMTQQLERFSAHLLPLLDPAHDGEPLEGQVSRVVDALARAYVKVPALAPLLQSLRWDPRFSQVAAANNEVISGWLSELVKRRAPRATKAQASAVAVTVVSAADAVLMAWLRTRDRALLVELKRLLVSYSQAALAI